MDYRRHVYPLRRQPAAFAAALLPHVNRSWSRIEAVGTAYHAERPGSGMDRPQPLDRIRVQAVLEAWTRRISDRYLDYPTVRRQAGSFPRNRPADAILRDEYNRLRQNYPAGAVKFMYNELTRDEQVTYARLHAQMDADTMYSTLLAWCDRHCYGLIAYLERFGALAGVGGGGSTLNFTYQAAQRFIHRAAGDPRSVYARYFRQATWRERAGVDAYLGSGA